MISGRSNKLRRKAGRTTPATKPSEVELLEQRTLLSVSFNTTQIGAGAHSTDAVLADVNGDGIPDLVLVHDVYNGQVRVRLGNGNGTFAPAEKIPVGEDPTDVIVSDLTNNGLNDIVVTNSLSGTVSVILQTPLGGLEQPVTFATGGADPTFVAAADIDGDNQPTGLIVANSGYGGTVDYLPGNGNGTFGYAQQVQVVNSTTYAAVQNTVQGDLVAVADLTGDGNPDLVVKYRIGYTTNYEVAILQGTGNGTFTRQFTVNNATAYQVFLAVGQDPKAFAVGDVNGDGMPDLLVANYSTYSDVRVLLNQGNGAFGAGVTYATGFDPDSIALADLSGDGQLDIITANRNEQSLTVLQGYGNGTFQPAQQFPLGLTSFPVFVGAGDINGDGKPDLVALNALAPNYSISILQNTTFEVFFTNVTDNTLTVTGTPGNDTISATALGQFFTVTENGVTSQQFPVVGITTMNVLGEDGNDSISIGPGIDGGIVAGGVSTTDPGTGADTVIAGNNETVYGGAAGDSMTSGDSTNVSLVGNVGADTLVAGEFNVTMLGGAGGDSLMGGPGLDLLLGGGGPDTIVAGIGNNTLVGGAGADSLTGGTGSDLLSGGAGPDTLVAIPANTLTANASTLLGGLGNDSMVFVGIDWVVGGGGNDTLAEQLDPYS